MVRSNPVFRIHYLVPILFTLAWAIGYPADSEKLDMDYQKKSASIDSSDSDTRLTLAEWCSTNGLIREMLKEIDLILERESDHESAHELLYQRFDGEDWVYDYTLPAPFTRPVTEGKNSANTQKKLLNKARSRLFKMQEKSYRFNFWSDLERDRVKEYGKLLNPYYDRLKKFFQISKTELGIDVFLFSTRSDFLNTFQRSSKRDMEHVAGFFRYDVNGARLFFYDRPYNEEEVFNTAKHECTHLLVQHCLQGARMPHWLNEGLACYFAGNGLERYGSYPAQCYLNVKHAYDNNSTITLEELIATPYSDFTFKHYAVSWSWIYFLNADPETKTKLSRFMSKLKLKAAHEETKNFEDKTHDLFYEMLGTPERLQPAWTAFVKDELDPVEPIQSYYCADEGLQAAGGWYKFDPPLEFKGKSRLLRNSESWLQKASSTTDNELATKIRLKKAFAVLARAGCMEYDLRETLFAATQIIEMLDGFLKDPVNDFLSGDAGLMAYRTLITIWRAGKYKDSNETVCDFPVLLAREEEQAIKEREEWKNTPQDKKLTEKIKLIGFQRKVVDCLIEQAKYAFRQSMALDPSNSRAARQWLFLALDFAPQDLAAVFPHLLFQAELDPDDFSLGALAAVYGGMGRQGFARTLLERALLITPKRQYLNIYAHYIETDDS